MISRRKWILGSAACAVIAMSPEVRAEDAQEDNVVFLTSDDGPGAGTEAIIEIAERYQVPVALFMIGMNAIGNAEQLGLLQRARGSSWITIGNHSESHCMSHYAHCYHDAKSVVADFERANQVLGLTSRPIPARGPGRNVWRLPGLRVDDPAISTGEMAIEDTTDDLLFANGFYLYGWDVEWLHDSRGIPVQTSNAMVDYLTGSSSHSRRPGKVVMLMHDRMMRTTSAASELVRIIEGVRQRGSQFGRLSEY